MGGRGDLVIVALSGGADSVCLFDVLYELKSYLGVELAAAHFNHKLRGDSSDRDELFAKKLAEDKGVQFFVGRGDVLKKAKRGGISIEMAGRTLRYEFFEKLAKKLKTNKVGTVKVALGHNANDQAETVLMRLLRGAGPRGLAGIPPTRGIFIRPLIEIPRGEIIGYLKAKKLSWVEDETNFSDDYLRNKIRHEVMRELEKNFNPNLVQTIVRTANACRDMVEFLEEEASSISKLFEKRKEEIVFSRALIEGKPPALAVAVVEQALSAFGRGLWAVRSEHRRAVVDALKSGKATKITLPYDVEIRVDSEQVIIRNVGDIKSPVFCYRLKTRGVTEIPEVNGYIETCVMSLKSPLCGDFNFRDSPFVAYLDYDKVKQPLEVRNFRAGDRFQPFGMKGEKKLQDFFVDLKVPREQRKLVPIITACGEIAWVAPYRIAHPYRITSATKRALKLSLRFGETSIM